MSSVTRTVVGRDVLMNIIGDLLGSGLRFAVHPLAGVSTIWDVVFDRAGEEAVDKRLGITHKANEAVAILRSAEMEKLFDEPPPKKTIMAMPGGAGFVRTASSLFCTASEATPPLE